MIGRIEEQQHRDRVFLQPRAQVEAGRVDRRTPRARVGAEGRVAQDRLAVGVAGQHPGVDLGDGEHRSSRLASGGSAGADRPTRPRARAESPRPHTGVCPCPLGSHGTTVLPVRIRLRTLRRPPLASRPCPRSRRSRRWRASRRSGAPAGRPTAPTASTAPRRGTRSSRSTRRRRPCRAPAPGPRLLATPTPTSSPATSGCAARRSSTRWGGTTTASTSSAASSSSRARSSTRRCPTTPTSGRPRGRPQGPPDPGQPAQLRRAVRAGRRAVRGGVPRAVVDARPVGRLDADLHDHRLCARRARRSAASCAWRSAASPTAASRRRCGTSTCRPPSPRPSSTTGRSPARTTASLSGGPTASRCSSTPRGPSCCRLRRGRRPPRRRALPAAVRPAGHDAAVRRRRSRSSPTSWPTPRRAPASP